METLGTRLKQLRKEKKMTQQQLADLVGVSKTSVIYWEKDENIPKHESLVALAEALKTSTVWLMDGVEDASTENINHDGNVRSPINGLRRIPILDFVQAGIFHEVGYDGLHPKGETYTSYQGSKPECVFSLIVTGLSMAPEFMPGDEIVVDASLAPKPGSLVIAQEVQHDVARTTFKKYRVIGVNEFGVDIIELVPLNNDFPTYNSTQIDISIIGVIVQHHRDINH